MSQPSHSEKSIRLFKSSFLEWFTHIHPSTPFILWLPVVGFLFYSGMTEYSLTFVTSFLLVIAGAFVWTFAEYTLHRYLFHFKPFGPISERIIYLFHGIHHDTPNDPTRLVMPPVISISLAIPFYFFFGLLLSDAYLQPFFAGFLLGYLAYDFMHYAIHHFKMTSKWGQYLKKYHMVHHFADHDAKWGVSSPLWDIIFKSVELKKNPR